MKRRNGDGIRSTIIRPRNLFLNFYILIQNSRKQIWRGIIIIIITITSLLPFLGPFEREKGGMKVAKREVANLLALFRPDRLLRIRITASGLEPTRNTFIKSIFSHNTRVLKFLFLIEKRAHLSLGRYLLLHGCFCS